MSVGKITLSIVKNMKKCVAENILPNGSFGYFRFYIRFKTVARLSGKVQITNISFDDACFPQLTLNFSGWSSLYLKLLGNVFF